MNYQPLYTLSENAVSRIAEIAIPRPVIYLMQETVRTVELDSSGRPMFSPDWPVGTIKARGVPKGGKKTDAQLLRRIGPDKGGRWEVAT